MLGLFFYFIEFSKTNNNMNYLKYKYIKYIIFILFLYILFSILIRTVNIYTILFLIIIMYIFYNIDKKLFKKLVYKVIYKNKKNTLSFKNTYGAAKISLEGVEKINKKINDKVKVELLNYQKNKLESQLKTGDYKVTLFGAGSSGKTSIARSLLKNIVGQTSAKIGTTKQINSYKIRVPIFAEVCPTIFFNKDLAIDVFPEEPAPKRVTL